MAEIDDNTFEYPGGMRQCISGFGINAIDDIDEAYELQNLEGQEVSGRAKAEFYIGELVRWCRYFNGECQRLKSRPTAEGE